MHGRIKNDRLIFITLRYDKKVTKKNVDTDIVSFISYAVTCT